MGLILNIETATNICSVALGQDGKTLFEHTDTGGQNHAKLLTILIQDLFKKSHSLLSNLDAVAISKGPGSYTGLRIGTSVAKGICYALGIPLIAINTLQAMANHAALSPNTLRCPMIDARRMEVYCQLFDKELNVLSQTEAKILDEKSFQEQLTEQAIAFFGDGATKFQEVCNAPNAFFHKNILPNASQMVALAEKSYQEQKFVDVAYFTPFYLKKFQVTTSKKRVF